MRTSRLNTIILSIIMMVGVVSLGFAQEEEMKVGVVNSNEVLQKSIEGKRILSQLEKKRDEKRQQLEKLDKEIRELQSKLNTQRLSLSSEAVTQLRNDIEEKQTRRKRMAEDMNREMQNMSQRLFQRVQQELLPIIEEIGKEKDLDLIFDLSQSGVIYFKPTINLTAQVIERYDAQKSAEK